MARSGVTLCSRKSPAPSAENTGRCPPNSPVDQETWSTTEFGNWCRNMRTSYKTHVRDISDLMQCINDTWANIITKRRRCWSMEKAVVCMREGKRTSLEHLLKPALFRTNTLHSWLFSEPPTVCQGKHVVSVSCHFHRSYLKANKISKSERIRKVEYACHFWKCADAVQQSDLNYYFMVAETTACQSWRVF